MLDIRGCRAKVERAQKHIEDFDRGRVAFLSTNPYSLVTEFDAKSNITTYRCGTLPVIPEPLRCIVGDAAHNLRTALDYIANALVTEAGVTPGAVYFPIAATAKKYPSEAARKTKGMPDWARQKIAILKPYEGGDNLLWGIHELDRVDKHRLLLAVSVRSGGLTVKQNVSVKSLNLVRDAKEGDTIAEVYGRAETHKNLKFPFDISLGEPRVLLGSPITLTLSQMANRVSEIIGDFAK